MWTVYWGIICSGRMPGSRIQSALTEDLLVVDQATVCKRITKSLWMNSIFCFRILEPPTGCPVWVYSVEGGLFFPLVKFTMANGDLDEIFGSQKINTYPMVRLWTLWVKLMWLCPTWRTLLVEELLSRIIRLAVDLIVDSSRALIEQFFSRYAKILSGISYPEHLKFMARCVPRESIENVLGLGRLPTDPQ